MWLRTTGTVAAAGALVVGGGRLLQLHEHIEQGVGSVAAGSVALVGGGDVEADVLGGDGSEIGGGGLRPGPGLDDEVEGVLPHGGDARPLPVGLEMKAELEVVGTKSSKMSF